MESAPVEVAVIQVGNEPFASTIPVTGTLISLAAVDVKAETTGRVIRFDRMEGDWVRAGETVVWLDCERAELAMRQAETAVQVADAALARTRVIESHNCQELERARNLVTSGGITDKDLKAASVAEQDGHAQVNLAKAQLGQARAVLAAAQKQVRDCQVEAPVNGIIQKKVVNPGTYVEAQGVLFSLVDNRQLELEAQVASSDLAPVKRGQKVNFSINSFPEVAFDGRVREISPAVESESRAALVRIQVENRSGRLRAGMFSQGEILIGRESEAVVVPMSAVYRDDTSSAQAFVYVIEKDKASRRPVTLGQERSVKVRVLEGLKPGDLLISERSIELADGVKVKAK
jgi:RND family efflux transporter MFP subunit